MDNFSRANFQANDILIVISALTLLLLFLNIIVLLNIISHIDAIKEVLNSFGN